MFVSETSSRHTFKTSSRRIYKTSSRCLGRRKIVTLKKYWRRLEDMSWRCLQDVLKTNKCLLGSVSDATLSNNDNKQSKKTPLLPWVANAEIYVFDSVLELKNKLPLSPFCPFYQLCSILLWESIFYAKLSK